MRLSTRTLGKVKKLDKQHTKDLVCREAYMEAKAYKKFKRKDVNNWPGYVKILSTIYKNIGDALVDSEEGVYIDRLGYFGAMIYQRNSVDVLTFDEDGLNPLINSHTNGAVFTLNFTPISRFKSMRTLLMDGTFSAALYKRFGRRLKSRKFYKNNLPLFLK